MFEIRRLAPLAYFNRLSGPVCFRIFSDFVTFFVRHYLILLSPERTLGFVPTKKISEQQENVYLDKTDQPPCLPKFYRTLTHWLRSVTAAKEKTKIVFILSPERTISKWRPNLRPPPCPHIYCSTVTYKSAVMLKWRTRAISSVTSTGHLKCRDDGQPFFDGLSLFQHVFLW